MCANNSCHVKLSSAQVGTALLQPAATLCQLKRICDADVNNAKDMIDR